MLAALQEHGSGLTEIRTPNKWCVYSKACLTYRERLVSYLARYTRKGAMQESRLVSVSDQAVSFKYRDYADNHRNKIMTLSCDEFLRRNLQHVLPKGFMRIRHYGFLANACRKRSLGLIRKQQTQPSQTRKTVEAKPRTLPQWPCKLCKTGMLTFTGIINSMTENWNTQRTS